MTYFAAAVMRESGQWSGREVDLEEVDDLEQVAEVLRELDGEDPRLLLVEQDDEWLGLVRVDADEDPRVFLSDRRAALGGGLAALLWEEEPLPDSDDDEDEGPRPVAEPVGDASLLSDLGIAAADLLELCSEEGMLPGDVLAALGERAGFAAVLDDLREG